MTFKNLISFNLFLVSLLFNFAHANITYKLDEARNLFNKKKYEEAYEIYIELLQNKVPEAEHYIALFQCYGTIKSIKKDDKKCISKLEELANNGYILNL